MEEILHQLMSSLSHYLQGFIHPRWCRISSINSITLRSTNEIPWKIPFVPGRKHQNGVFVSHGYVTVVDRRVPVLGGIKLDAKMYGLC